ncbi:MAG: L-2-hydroxyglutarate oxidase [Actinomycetota bacterium]|nr:L-2-hydroxyglutarate oxidase [Actinomycetota bacterium]
MITPRFDVVVVGGGIVGLATARELRSRGLTVAVLEAESAVATHQTGRNSNVIHSGLYYRPGSHKARLAVAGRDETVAFCRAHDLPHRIGGKLVVATEPEELPRLAELARRGRANGVECRELSATEASRHEPAVRALAALLVPSTGVCDFGAIAAKLAALLVAEGGSIFLGRPVRRLTRRRSDMVVHTAVGDVLGRRVVACAGLHGDELARRSGCEPGVRIVPFRGEYAGLLGSAADLVREQIYPVPDPALPFLGVHVTRGVDNEVRVGPNAVLALAREGYRWSTVRPRELAATLAYPGLHRLTRRHWRHGLHEVRGSLSRSALAARVRRMLPDVRAADLVPAGAGVRAQAVRPDGGLVDDFLFVTDGSADGRAGSDATVLYVLNAPSPAATAALPIGREIATRLTGERRPVAAR